MRYIPTDSDLKKQVSLVEIEVSGEYIARIDEKRRTTRSYKIKVLVPQGYNKGDIKRLTPRQLMKDKEGDFIALRTFEETGGPKKTEKKAALSTLYSSRELARFSKLNGEFKKERDRESDERRQLGDTSQYGNDGLPPVINDR